ncbi:MAG: hypothetical protein D8M58_06885 [Calditrichaeota bacterium]|nr:MAG: hypothetical protein DWQ03_19615 [Calditrichota bacterium]MBL1205104.1 hypothetical protein [Calditrichota bacterium]NOG44934.1 hypothetical protein [Calditrichota bacterium]
MEDQIFEEARNLKPIKPDNDLWDKIENTLIEETQPKPKNVFQFIKNHKMWLSIAAALLISFSMATLYFNASPNPDAKILSTNAMIKVEFTEKNYMKAIEQLEVEAKNQLANFDTELMLLYRDKLTTIETQINQCKEAIANNPGNAHIRKYMLAALQDKKNTLNEIINFDLEIKS